MKKSNIANEVVAANDGQEALNHLSGNGKHTGRDLKEMPVLTVVNPASAPKVTSLNLYPEYI